MTVEKILIHNKNGTTQEVLKSHLPHSIYVDSHICYEHPFYLVAYYLGGDIPISAPWHPWLFQYGFLERWVPVIEDKQLRNKVIKLHELNLALHDLNIQWGIELAKLFKYPTPSTKEHFAKIGRKRRRFKKSEPLPWLTLPEFQPLINQLNELQTLTEIQYRDVLSKIIEVYDFVVPEPLGDQRAKDQIRMAHGAMSEKVAIKHLKKALTYGSEGLFAKSANGELGLIYARQNKLDLAIEYLTKSIEGVKNTPPEKSQLNTTDYLVRGLAFYDKGDLDSAKRDLDISMRLFGEEVPHGYEEEFARAKEIVAGSS